ncbi:MAG TPA: pitrilysin family protein [Vicinamibacterales bacterium]|nr:pitrilysin family protein [Vicinamibacterales bacterium]
MNTTALAPIRVVLPNGAVLLARRTQTTPAVTINIAIRAGSVCDPADAPGSMYLLSKVIDRGTLGASPRSADDIAEALDSRGISLGVTVTRHLFSFFCTCLADDFDEVMALVADIVRAPSLPEDELETRKGEVLTVLRQDEDNPGVRATEALMDMLYPPPHPYGRRTKGTAQIVEGLTRDRLAALHSSRFAPGVMSLVVVGDVDTGRAEAVAARVFGGWSAPEPAPVAATPLARATSRRRVVIPMMNKAQADIAYGFTTLVRTDPEYYACWLMNHAFGQYSMSGRLGDSIRERQGMAYYAYSQLDANVMEGPLLIRAGVSAANIDRAVASIDEEVRKLVTEGLTQKELDDSRRFLIYAMPRALETNAGIANYLQTAEFFGLGLDYDVRVPELLRRVTLEQANAVARKYLSVDRASLVIAGPCSA